ncbi:peptidase, partial [Bacillus mycoides]|nr:peptidase [Bacillus mycoides]
MGKTSKYVTAAALCSTIVMGGLQASSVSYAATNPTTVTTQSDAKLLNDFRKELKKQIDNREENITIAYKTKDRDARKIMDQLYGEFNKIVDADEYVKYNVASTRYSIKGMPGNYTFTLQVEYRESKEQTQYVKSQAKAIVNSIIKQGMDEHEKVKAIHDYVVKEVS